jgi:hypothetical protein
LETCHTTASTKSIEHHSVSHPDSLLLSLGKMAYIHYDLEKKSRDVRNLEKDMQYSRSAFVTWGKDTVFAIDRDHAGRLIHTFKTKKHLGADVDAQTSKAGYGGYSWTVYIHNFLGTVSVCSERW